ncbi:MAG: hypothetical protein CVU90_11060 [Firmicutes bacterium HGW-Firmicutes-15]|nr:MAG: hypothetical protein CVU90_11060 [Firmicutes bacterium HGW-Firmicutes-15]
MKKEVRNNFILDAILFLLMMAMPVSANAELHGALGLILVSLVTLHIIWHWKQIKVLYRQFIPESRSRIIAAFVFGVLSISVLLMPLYLPSERDERARDFETHGSISPR